LIPTILKEKMITEIKVLVLDPLAVLIAILLTPLDYPAQKYVG